MKIVVGLGNPGQNYIGTRHNIGFDVIDILAQGPGGGKYQQKFEAAIVEGMEGFEKVLYMKPLTFMNLSGRAVRAAMDFYKVMAPEVLIVCDDVNLILGQIRIRAGGSAGGHNGLKDIEKHLGTQNYPRLRIGVSSPGRLDLADYVLSRFKPSELDVVRDANIRAAQAVACWIKEGIEVAMNRFNAPEKEQKKQKSKSSTKEDNLKDNQQHLLQSPGTEQPGKDNPGAAHQKFD
ncbi:MAG TPA: aminoacyl-tRNA hydrolase [Gemmatales bacterium]|nr:aminoacyl-tRNA hydrolase [Gemmatales bacterium]HMP18651.1 aminoacyl-tRNA hydrolase [Gemmatales bacterium]